MSSTSVPVRNPYDGTIVGEVPRQSAGDAHHAVGVASEALEASALPLYERARILDMAAQLLSERSEDFAQTIAAEAAKPLKTARVEAERAATTFTFAAVAARTLAGDVVPMDATQVGAGKLAFTLRVPIGVVAGISSFNFPLNLVAHKVAPSIAAGCPIVLKPALETPLSSIKLRSILDECGLPPEWFQVLTGEASEVGEALVEDDRVAYVSFTGSEAVGWSIRQKAARKKVGLELGNNAPVIVEPDSDWRTAARQISTAGFSHAGQSCVSTQRVYVHEEIADAFEAVLVKHVKALQVGDPLDPRTDVSALIRPRERERVCDWIAEAIDGGATAACGNVIEGTVLHPTVLTDVRPEMRVSRAEVFGPVVGLQTYRSFDEAIRLADDTTFGLQAAVFTSSIAKAVHAARSLHFGSVLVNEVPTWRADQMPYGGVRSSGNTKEGPQWAVREMTDERLVVLSA